MPNGRCRIHGGKSPGAPKGNKNPWVFLEMRAKARGLVADLARIVRGSNRLRLIKGGHTGLRGYNECLSQTSYLQTCHHVCPMHLDGADVHAQALGELLVGQGAQEAPENFQFPPTEGCDPRYRISARPLLIQHLKTQVQRFA